MGGERDVNKKGGLNSLDYRPIRLTSAVGKMLMSITARSFSVIWKRIA